MKRLIVTMAAVAAAVVSIGPRPGQAQGVTTGAISGQVTDPSGQALDAVQIQIVNRSTGFGTGTITRANGRYIVQGLEVGGPYSVTARRIGFAPQTVNGIQVQLSQTARVDFQLATQATQLTAVTVTQTREAADFSPSTKGSKTTISDTALRRLPVLDRNLTGFIRLTPQVSTSGAGFSAGGMSNRMNNVQIDGATERDAFGLGSTGQPGAQASARSISIEAVKELQVLLAPFDVRQGNFGGLLLNAVTKSGTNDLTGSAYYFGRTEAFGANVPILRATDYQKQQFGFSVGGPILRDKLHFFVAPEFQREYSPLSGPFLGQAAGAAIAFPASEADVQRLNTVLAQRGLQDPGSAGYVEVPNPLNNLFARVDYRINETHRLVARYNFSTAELLRSQNGRGQNAVVFSSNLHDFRSVKQAPVVQLFSNFRNGASNELFLGLNQQRDRRVPKVVFPQVTVSIPRANGSGTVNAIVGADQFSQVNELDVETYELTNNFTYPVGNHILTVGTRNELVKLRNQFNQSSFGVWSFRSIDSLAAGNANSFRRSIILRDNGNVFFDALQSAAYAQDQWQATPRLNLTLGLRADITGILTDNAYNAAIDSAYGRRTDDTPSTKVQLSPRIGFNWDVTGNQVNQLRGGIGLFMGTPPYVWIENAYINNGSIITFLNCNTAGSRDPAPPFQSDPTSIQTCRNGRGSRPIGDVNFVDRDLSFPQPLRATLAYDRQLPWGLVASVEGLFSKALNQFFFVNRNLAGPRGADRNGRVLYGDTILTNGQALPALPPRVIAAGGSSRFSTAIDLTNHNKDYAYNVTAQLRKRFTGRWEAQGSYTFSRARDVQSFGSSTHISNWQFGRTYGRPGQRQEDPFLGVSLFDQPHKVLLAGTYSLPWRGMSTDISMIYEGVSGGPFDYVYRGGPTSGSGDMNADGRNGNDLIYVPRSATDPNEIRFQDIPASGSNPAISAQQQAQAFEQYISNSQCLSRYRGQIMERNSCRQPFYNRVDLTIQQSLPTIRGQRASLRLEVYNFGNLVGRAVGQDNWGQQQVTEASSNSNVPLLEHRGQTSVDPKTAQSIFNFNVNQREFIHGSFASNFWRAQFGVRYAF